MNTYRTALAAVLLSVPFAANADTLVFSGKQAYGSLQASGYVPQGYATAYVNVFRSATKTLGVGTDTESGADVSIEGYGDNGCFFGWGSTTNIEFTSAPSGGVAKSIAASGTIPVYVYDCNTGQQTTDELAFVAKLSATSTNTYDNAGSGHSNFSGVRFNTHYDYTASDATFAGSSVSTTSMGTLEPNAASIGTSKSHNVSITR